MAKQQPPSSPSPGSVSSETLGLYERSVQYSAQQLELTRDLTSELKDILNIREKIASGEKATLDIFRDLQRSVGENVEQLRKEEKLLNAISKDKRTQLSIEREIVGIQLKNFDVAKKYRENAEKLSKAQRAQQDAEKKFREATTKFYLAQEQNSKKAIKDSERALSAAKRDLAIKDETLKTLNDSLSVDEKRYGLLLSARDISKKNLENKQNELRLSYEINKNLGIGGALLDNLDKIGVRFFGGLGLNLGVFKEALHDAKEAMDDVATAYAKVQDNAKKYAQIEDKNSEAAKELREEQEKYLVVLAQRSKFGKEFNELNEELLELQSLQGDLTEEQKDRYDEINKRVRSIKAEVESTAVRAGTFKKTLDSMVASFPGIKKGIMEIGKDAFTSGTVAITLISKTIGGIFNAVKRVDQPLTDMARSLGISRQEAYNIRYQFSQASTDINSIFVTSQKLSETFGRIAQQYGFTVTANTKLDEGLVKNLATMTKMTEQGKFSAEAADTYFQMSTLSNKSVDDLLSSTGKIVVASNLQNKVALNTRQVLEGTSKASASMRLHMSKSPEALIRASAAALALGTDLQKLQNIASGMLDFEQSISNEMEAQLITGKEFSLAGLRYASAFGTAEDQARELGKVMSDMNLTGKEWANMNAFARESSAKALNMSEEELANMIARRDILKTTSQAAYNDYKAKWDNLMKTKTVEEALAEMGENELTRQFATTSNAEKMEAIQQRIYDLLEKFILPMSEKVIDKIYNGLQGMTNFLNPIGKTIDKLGLSGVGTVIAGGAVLSALVAMGAKMIQGSNPLTPIYTKDVSLGAKGGEGAKGGGLAGKILKGATGVGAIAGAGMGVYDILANSEGKTKGVGDFVEQLGGVGLDALSGATFGLAGALFGATGITIPGMSGAQSATARTIYNNKYGKMGSNKEVVEDIKKNSNDYPSGLVALAQGIDQTKLAVGGIVPATPGGRSVTVAEGGQAEAVIPLNKLPSMVGQIQSPAMYAINKNLFDIRTNTKDQVKRSDKVIDGIKTVGEGVRESVDVYKGVKGDAGFNRSRNALDILRSKDLSGRQKSYQLFQQYATGNMKDMYASGQDFYNAFLKGGFKDAKKTVKSSLGEGFDILKGRGSLKDKAGMLADWYSTSGGQAINTIGRGVQKGKFAVNTWKTFKEAGGLKGWRKDLSESPELDSIASVKGFFKRGEDGTSRFSRLTGKLIGRKGPQGAIGIGDPTAGIPVGQTLGVQKGGGILGKLLGGGATGGGILGGGGAAGGGLLGGLGGGGGALAGLAGAALPVLGIGALAAGAFFGGRALIRKRRAAKEREKQRKQRRLDAIGPMPKSKEEFDEMVASGAWKSKIGEASKSGKKVSKRTKRIHTLAKVGMLGAGGLIGASLLKKKGKGAALAAGMFGIAGIAGAGLLGKRRRRRGGGSVSPEIPEEALEPGMMEADTGMESIMPEPTESLGLTRATAPGISTGTGTASSAEVVKKLDELISIVGKGTGVFLNGNKVGEALVLSATSTS